MHVSQVNQIDMASNNIVRTWESIAAAARNLTVSLSEINGALANRTDSAGGFKWEYVLASAGMGGVEKSGEEGEEDDFEDEVRISLLLCVCILYIAAFSCFKAKGGKKIKARCWLLLCCTNIQNCSLIN